MRGRLIILLLLVGAFLCAQPLQEAAAQPSSQPPLELGFSLGSLSPTTDGVPVYTAGDALWVMSDFQAALVLELSSPNGTVVASAEIEPQAPILLYSFPGLVGSGTWILTEIILQTSEILESFPLLVVGSTSVSPSMTEYSLSSSGQLSMNFTTASSNAYDFLACAVGGPAADTLSIPLPASLGSGSMFVTMNRSTIQVTPNAQVATPFSFWVELHQDYAYVSGGTSTVVSRDLEVAASTAVPVSSSNGTSSLITTFVHMRPGRFTLRAFFDSSKGLSAAEAPMLIPSDSSGWIPLQSCASSSNVPSSAFTLSSTLGSSTQAWPQEVYLMYLEDGVEMYSVTPVQVQPAAISVIAAPWGTSFTDSQLSFQPGPGVQESASAGGLIFLTATQYPLQVGISLSKGESQTVQIPSAYSYLTVKVNSSKLIIDTIVAGETIPGANITISSGDATISAAKAGFGGTAIFYVPQGSYGVTATFDRVNRTAGVLAEAGNASTITFNFPGPSAPGLVYAYLLIGTGAAGLTASVLVWAKVYRGRVG